MKTINYHNDPGHGWYEAPIAELIRLKITDIISAFSYVSKDRQTVYLEEDCDATTYFAALEADGVDLNKTKSVNLYMENTFIRELRPYTKGIHFDLFCKTFKSNLQSWIERKQRS